MGGVFVVGVVAAVVAVEVAVVGVIGGRLQVELGKGLVGVGRGGPQGAHVGKEQLDTMQKLHFQM